MAKETLAIDIDEVLYPFLDEFIVHHNAEYNTQLTREDFDSYNFEGPLGLEIPEMVKRVYAFTGMTADIQVDPLKEARESIVKLSDKYDLVVVTARHPSFEDITINWLERHFPDYFKHVELIGHPALVDKPLTKAEVCLRLGATALIDDSLLHTTQVAEIGIKGILFGNYKWNQMDVLPERVVRCENWSAVLKHLLIES
jgi:5'(3')-deoxyribonucleotidase